MRKILLASAIALTAATGAFAQTETGAAGAGAGGAAGGAAASTVAATVGTTVMGVTVTSSMLVMVGGLTFLTVAAYQAIQEQAAAATTTTATSN